MRKLTVAAAITGGALAVFIYLALAFTGIAMLGTFFLLGTLATTWKAQTKERTGMGEVNKGRRTATQVLANGGAGALLSFGYFLNDNLYLLPIMVAAAFASATADTLSSELGTLYGSRFYNIITFKRDRKGLDGVISAEGTLIGIFGSILIACIYSIGYGWSLDLAWITIAGTAGNVMDSILGATAERKQFIGNNAVNFLNTVFAAAVVALLAFLFH